MHLSPLDSWWRKNFNIPYGSTAHKESSPIYQAIDYIEYIDSVYMDFEDIIEEHKKEAVDDEGVLKFLEGLEGAEAITEMARKELLNK